MTVYEKKQFISYLELKNELDGYTAEGTLLLLEGRASSAEKIASLCVFSEESDYMRDYITDEAGRLLKLDFNSVKNT